MGALQRKRALPTRWISWWGWRGLYRTFGSNCRWDENFAPGQTADLAVKYVKQVDDGVEWHRLEESCIVEPTEILSHPEKYPDWDLLRVLHKGVR